MTMIQDLASFDYKLPQQLLAHEPAPVRDRSKLMVVARANRLITHGVFGDLETLLGIGDVLVLNNTKVFRARLRGKKDSGGAVELLLTQKRTEKGLVEALVGGTVRVGQKVWFDKGVWAEIVARDPQSSIVKARFSLAEKHLNGWLESVGLTPLPPYIDSPLNENQRHKRYQTVYAKALGSCAAPTAGLHFTQSLLDRLRRRGVVIAEVTLHVGLGTFLGVTGDNLKTGTLHAEEFEITRENALIINEAIRSGKRIVAVGTTTTRCLESAAVKNDDSYAVEAGPGKTDIFIKPGYVFKVVDGLITNFHLPKSSLLMLVTALVSAPNTDDTFSSFDTSLMGKAYTEAIKHQYRFYSFGDAMFIC